MKKSEHRNLKKTTQIVSQEEKKQTLKPVVLTPPVGAKRHPAGAPPPAARAAGRGRGGAELETAVPAPPLKAPPPGPARPRPRPRPRPLCARWPGSMAAAAGAPPPGPPQPPPPPPPEESSDSEPEAEPGSPQKLIRKVSTSGQIRQKVSPRRRPGRAPLTPRQPREARSSARAAAQARPGPA